MIRPFQRPLAAVAERGICKTQTGLVRGVFVVYLVVR